MPERTFTEAEVLQIVGFMTADLEELHAVEVPRMAESAQRAMQAIKPVSSAREGQLERGALTHQLLFPRRV